MNINPRLIITAVPLVMVNSVALIGQIGFIRDHTTLPVIGAVIFAGAIESIALYLAYMAHTAMLSLDSSLRLRLGAYFFGLLAAAMNYSHYSHGYRPTFLSVATGIMSASSPWLWGIYSRRQSRDKMRELGLIEPGAVRLGANRWIWHFRKSFAVYRLAAWDGIREPAQAISAWENSKPEPQPEPQPVPQPASEPAARPQRQAVPDRPRRAITGRVSDKSRTVDAAFQALGSDVPAPEIVAWCAQRGVTVTDVYVRQRRSRAARRAVNSVPDNVRAITSGAVNE